MLLCAADYTMTVGFCQHVGWHEPYLDRCPCWVVQVRLRPLSGRHPRDPPPQVLTQLQVQSSPQRLPSPHHLLALQGRLLAQMLTLMVPASAGDTTPQSSSVCWKPCRPREVPAIQQVEPMLGELVPVRSCRLVSECKWNE